MTKRPLSLLLLAASIGCTQARPPASEPLSGGAATATPIAVAVAPTPTAVIASDCDLEAVTTVQTDEGSFSLFRERTSGVVLFRGRFHVDADGSPRAYGPGDTGIDHIGNAQVDIDCRGASCALSANVIEFTTKNGARVPCTHSFGEPPKTYYTAMTSLRGGDFPACDTRRYVNAEEVSFFVLPGGSHKAALLALGVKAGDEAIAMRETDGTAAPALVGDFGPPKELGEGSMKLAGALGYGIDPGYRRVEQRSGTERREVVYLVFPNTRGSLDPNVGHDWPRDVAQVMAASSARFQSWGGVARLKACAAKFS